MKKTILALAMLFSITILGQSSQLSHNDMVNDFTGIWNDDNTGDYYTVILNNEEEGYKFLNFSFGERDVVEEIVMEVSNDSVKTMIINHDNGWRLYCEYTYVDENTLAVNYSGRWFGSSELKRRKIK